MSELTKGQIRYLEYLRLTQGVALDKELGGRDINDLSKPEGFSIIAKLTEKESDE